jgi:hypothetical protein
MARVEELKNSGSASSHAELQAYLSPDELHILNTVRAREMVRSEDTVDLNNFQTDIIDGRALNMTQGSLGLISAQEVVPKKSTDILGAMIGEENKLAEEQLIAVAQA